MEVKPLVVEPCIKKALDEVIAADVKFLSDNKLLDYSLDLAITYDSTEPKCATGPIGEDAKSPVKLNGMDRPKGNLFSHYKGGIRAVGVYGDRPEKALYVMQILDFLGEDGFIKSFSKVVQSGRVNKIEGRMPEIIRDIAVTAGIQKCKNLAKGSVDPGEGIQQSHFCWTGCGFQPDCVGTLHRGYYEHKLKDKKAHQFERLASFDFNKEFAEDALSCTGTFNIAGRHTRSLCVATTKANGVKNTDLESIFSKDTVPSMPNPFREQMSDAEIKADLEDPYKLKILADKMNQKLHPDAPMILKRVGVMSYYDFARKPYKEDTVSVSEYADRFKRFVGAWITSPTEDEFKKTCPLSDPSNSSARCPSTDF